MAKQWPTVTLGSVAKRVTAKNKGLLDRVFTVSAEFGLVDQEKFFNKRVASKNLAGYTVIDPGTYVYNKSYSATAPLGVVTRNRYDAPGVVSPIYIAFKQASDDLAEGFLDLAIHSSTFAQTLRAFVKEGGRAHGGVNVSSKDFFETRIPLPTLTDQRRIVHFIGSVDSYIDALRVQVDAARTTRTSLLHELLNAGGEDWGETTLGEVASWSSGGTPKSSVNEYYDGGVPWCVIGDLTESGVYATARTISDAGLQGSSARLTNPGTVLLAMYGASIGRTGITKVAMATNQAIACAVPDTSVILALFLLIYLQDQKYHFKSAGQGAAQPNISQSVIKNWPIVLPPLAEQRRIVDLVGAVDSTISATNQTRDDAIALRTALLTDLLSGTHEIPGSYDALLEAS